MRLQIIFCNASVSFKHAVSWMLTQPTLGNREFLSDLSPLLLSDAVVQCTLCFKQCLSIVHSPSISPGWSAVLSTNQNVIFNAAMLISKVFF